MNPNGKLILNGICPHCEKVCNDSLTASAHCVGRILNVSYYNNVIAQRKFNKSNGSCPAFYFYSNKYGMFRTRGYVAYTTRGTIFDHTKKEVKRRLLLEGINPK